MGANAEILRIQKEKSVVDRIEEFIRTKKEELGRDGVILGLSGGVDSVFLAYLSKGSVGRENVLGLYMPEKDSNPQHRRDAEEVAERLEIRFKIEDLTPLVEAQGAYDLPPIKYLQLLPGRRLKGWTMRVIKYLMEMGGRDLFIESRRGTSDRFVAGGAAYAHFKHRLRMAILYYHAELNNLLVAGAINRTEYLTGAFVKFGIDGKAVDIMPLIPFYNTQVKQLARYVGVPRKILEKPKDPDLFPGFSNKEKMFGKEEQLDLVLLGLEKGLSLGEIVEISGATLKEVKRVCRLVETSRHMRESPYPLDLEP